MREVFGKATHEELVNQDERAALILSVPELRMRMLDELMQAIQVFAELIAKRIGRRPDDIAVRSLPGAVVGVGIAARISARGGLASDLLALMDDAFAQLEAGFSL